MLTDCSVEMAMAEGGGASFTVREHGRPLVAGETHQPRASACADLNIWYKEWLEGRTRRFSSLLTMIRPLLSYKPYRKHAS